MAEVKTEEFSGLSVIKGVCLCACVLSVGRFSRKARVGKPDVTPGR